MKCSSHFDELSFDDLLPGQVYSLSHVYVAGIFAKNFANVNEPSWSELVCLSLLNTSDVSRFFHKLLMIKLMKKTC